MEVCKVCQNTGMRPGSDDLDCADCNAAVERTALNKFSEEWNRKSLYSADLHWAIHQRALAMAPKQEAPAQEPVGRVAKSPFGPHKALVLTVKLDDIPLGSKLYLAAPAAANGDLPELPPFPKTDVEGGYYDSESGFTKKTMQEYAATYGRSILAAAGPNAALVALIHKAQSILARHLPPDGPDAKTTISELLRLLDGPESRAALSGAKGN